MGGRCREGLRGHGHCPRTSSGIRWDTIQPERHPVASLPHGGAEKQASPGKNLEAAGPTPPAPSSQGHLQTVIPLPLARGGRSRDKQGVCPHSPSVIVSSVDTRNSSSLFSINEQLWFSLSRLPPRFVATWAVSASAAEGPLAFFPSDLAETTGGGRLLPRGGSDTCQASPLPKSPLYLLAPGPETRGPM